jgi:endoglucanase
MFWQSSTLARSFAPIIGSAIVLFSCATQQQVQTPATISELEYFESTGVNVLAFSNPPGGLFFDAKTSGIEIIHHGERTATNGDVRLLPVPEQWDGMGQLVSRSVDRQSNSISTKLTYPEHDFSYTVTATAVGDHYVLSVHLDQPLPAKLVGKAGFNMEFLPSVYWDKAFLADGKAGRFPRAPSQALPMRVGAEGLTEPAPLAQGTTLVLAPEAPEQRVEIRHLEGEGPLMLFDGRTKAQNGWYVVRSLIPAGKTGQVLAWELKVKGIPGWVRPPVIGHSQVGYHPRQLKRAVIELDKKAGSPGEASLLRVNGDGSKQVVLSGRPQAWGSYLRYNYVTFDFSSVTEPGLYQLQYGDQVTSAFRIDERIFADVWQPTLDFYFPVQMDHMKVREAYRVWHGLSHMDDALQAPPNYEHFDLFAHDANLDTKFKPFEHIPGLNIGGWYDAGDFDIRTQSQYQAVQELVLAYEEFGIERDNTTIDQAKHYVEINRPDGKNDMLQQIEHGTLALIAQHRAVGHAIPGIVEAHLYQYPHLGDGSTKTDNRIYSKKLDPHADKRGVGRMYNPSTVDPTPSEDVMPDDGRYSGRFDDRWAFTSNTTALNYGSAAALAAAGRVLRTHNPALAQECLDTAKKVWEYEAGRTPNTYFFGNTTGGRLEDEKLKAAVQLLISTRNPKYATAVRELLPQMREHFRGDNIAMLVLALPFMDAAYASALEEMAQDYREKINEAENENPFGVPITRGGWAGNSAVMSFGVSSYWLNKVFPEVVEDELVYRSLNYIFGTHPDSNYSFVSGVGARSQTQAYGNNRADFSFIPGGVVPGVLVLPPDYPENKSDWPFFWGQNEYVIPMGSRYIFLVHAAQKLLMR